MYPARWFRRSIPRSGIGLAIALSLATQASDALACACCSEPGERVESSGKLDPYEKPELERLRFAKTAHLYLTAAGFEGVSGIADPASTYALGFSRAGERWTFTFKDAKGAASTLAFTLPSKIESFSSIRAAEKRASRRTPSSTRSGDSKRLRRRPVRLRRRAAARRA